VNLNEKKPDQVPKERLRAYRYVLFIVVNTYTVERLALGPGPLNDSLTVAYHLSLIGYRVVFLHNTTTLQFSRWLRFLFQNVSESLVMFYTGHGASIKDKSGDEEDGFDEVMVFNKGYILDDELGDYLIRDRGQLLKKNPNARTILISDCCHSGTLWDIDEKNPKYPRFPKGVLSLSAALDSQTAKQTAMNKLDQGLFTFYFWNLWKDNHAITPNEVTVKLSGSLKNYKQEVLVSTTSPELRDQPIFPERPPRPPGWVRGRGRSSEPPEDGTPE
jgi:hypothetical protein